MKGQPKNPHAQALGKLGGLAGKGKAKARPSEQMRAAAQKRWTKTNPAAAALEQWNKERTK